MPVTFVAFSSGYFAEIASKSVAVPTGTATGDLLVAFMCENGTGGTWPDGFTQISLYTASRYSRCAYRVVQNGDPTSYTWSFTGLKYGRITLLTYRGQGASPIDQVSTALGGSPGAVNGDITLTSSSLTPTAGGLEVLLCTTVAGTAAPNTWTLPAITTDATTDTTLARHKALSATAVAGTPTGTRATTYSKIAAYCDLHQHHFTIAGVAGALPIFAAQHAALGLGVAVG